MCVENEPAELDDLPFVVYLMAFRKWKAIEVNEPNREYLICEASKAIKSKSSLRWV